MWCLVQPDYEGVWINDLEFCQKSFDHPLETGGIVQEDVVVAIGNLGQLKVGTTGLGLGEELWCDARTAATLDHEGGNGDLTAMRNAVEAIPLGVDVTVKLMRPAPIGKLPAPALRQMADDLRGSRGAIRAKPVALEELFMGSISAAGPIPYTP